MQLFFTLTKHLHESLDMPSGFMRTYQNACLIYPPKYFRVSLVPHMIRSDKQVSMTLHIVLHRLCVDDFTYM
jgi:hypothetical protein